MCDRWIQSFENFYEDMGECPPKLSLERINVNGNYEPDNCCWATDHTQAQNRTNARLVTYFGTTRTMTEWLFYLGTTWKVLSRRIRRYGAEEGIMRVVLERATRLPGPPVGKPIPLHERRQVA